MSAPLASPPKKRAILNGDGLRDAAAQAVADSGLTQARVASVVAERIAGRDRPPSPAAISNAVRESSSKVEALQLDIIRALTGASLTGPLYRVD
ncbi:hypothetical protein [Rubrivirga sp.]|uniref:hypothetical protein n=1 Tax=Rubrivirga sp. TaxID=1885344 RepID=UPI003C774269